MDMKVSRAKVAEHRENILAAAEGLFRRKGFDGVGVTELMAAAGLTNGAFYGHFGSKADLMAAACERAAIGGDPWADLADGRSMERFVADYLAPAHRDARDQGCLFAALSADVARQGPAVRRSFTATLRDKLGALTARRSRAQAVATLATLAGAIMLARAVDDPALSDEILAAAREAVS